MDKKRIALIIVFILATIGLGFALYYVFFRQAPISTGPVDITDIPRDTGSFPQSGLGGDRGVDVGTPTDLPSSGGRDTTGGVTPGEDLPQVTRRITDGVIGAAPTKQNGLQFYNNSDGKFYRINDDGTTRLLSNEVFFNVEQVHWSPNDSEAILEYPDGSNIYYNFDTQKQVSLPRHWEEFSFSDTSGQVAAKSIGLAPENRWILATNPDGTNVKLVEPLGNNADKVDVSWSPNQQIIATSRTGQALGADREEILFVGLNGENFKSMIVEGRGLQYDWSPEGNQMIYSVYSARSDYKPELWIVDATPSTIGENRRPLNLQTWADKCTFSNNRFVYCAVPQSLETGAGFAPAIANTVPDELYRIDTQTGARTRILLDDENYTIDSLTISEQEDRLYFTTKNQQGLFSVDI